jgi:hypothetical protein
MKQMINGAATIVLLYTCEPCGVKDQEVTVRTRNSGEELDSWMREAQTRVTIDHQKRSPNCTATNMTEMKVPMGPGGESSTLGTLPH